MNKLSYNEESTTEQIVSILKETNATIKDFSQTLDLSENIVRTTINRLKKHGVVKHTGMFINRYKLWRLAKPEELDVNANFEEYREILIKMILPFAKSGIKVELLPSEQEKIRELFEDNYDPSGERKGG